VNTSEQIDQIAVALVAVQKAMKPAIKDATNPHFKSKYADLAAVWEACREPLSAHGIFAGQNVTGDDRTTAVTTRLIHSSGQWIEFGPLVIPLNKQDAQAVGSATSYARRYSLGAALGIVAEDDDGNAATASAPRQESRLANGNGNAPKPVQAPRETVNKQAGEITDAGVLTIRDVSAKDGATNGRKWTKFTIHFSDGSKATTLDRKMGELAQKAKASGATVRPLTKQGTYGTDLEALDVVAALASAMAPVTAQVGMLEEPEWVKDVPDDDVPF
jgi:hypothetical protein